LEYGHGDLHIYNLGVYNKNIYLLDLDTVYKLDDLKDPPSWLYKWITEGYDIDIVNDKFSDVDFDNWRSDWLDE